MSKHFSCSQVNHDCRINFPQYSKGTHSVLIKFYRIESISRLKRIFASFFICCQFLIRQILLIKQCCHLTIYPSQSCIITILGCSISLLCSLMIILQSCWCLMHISIHAAQNIISKHTIIG